MREEELETKRQNLQEKGQETAASIQGVSILLSEDNDLNMEIATELLKEEGAKVTQVWNGQEAVETVENNPPGTFDVIPIVALTANAFFDDVKNAWRQA